MEMLGGLQGGGGGCGTPGLWLTVIGWTPATLTACSQRSQSQWEKPKHEAQNGPHTPKRKTDGLMTDKPCALMNYMYVAVCVWVSFWGAAGNSGIWHCSAPTHRARAYCQLGTSYFLCMNCVCEWVSLVEWAHYRGDNNAVGNLRDDCVQESQWRQSWRNALFSTPRHPKHPGEGERTRACLRVMFFHLLSALDHFTRLLQKHNFNLFENSLIFYIVLEVAVLSEHIHLHSYTNPQSCTPIFVGTINVMHSQPPCLTLNLHNWMPKVLQPKPTIPTCGVYQFGPTKYSDPTNIPIPQLSLSADTECWCNTSAHCAELT